MGEQEKPKLEARIVEPVAGAGPFWWEKFLRNNANEIERRFRSGGTVFWTVSEKVPADVFSYISEASICFSVALYLATIALSSVVVELILNRDSCTKGLPLRRFGEWAILNNENLRMVGAAGLPVVSVVSPSEDLANKEPIRFVERRNKVAHGEVSDVIRGVSRYDPGAEAEAFDQLKKSQSFAVAWFNTAPDIQG